MTFNFLQEKKENAVQKDSFDFKLRPKTKKKRIEKKKQKKVGVRILYFKKTINNLTEQSR